MLRTLSVRNGFVHQNLNITFKEGQTAIVGKNGKGKSLISEFAQYALWGTKALRGDAEDYKKLQVSVSFDVKGKSYAVHRSGSNVTLIGPDGPLASGTKFVNPAIEKLFGYDYNVFQIANAANQGEIAKLSAMGPADRKRMVDRTIGLDVIDALEKFVSDQARTLRGRIDGLRSAIVQPTAPEPPDNYGPTEGVQAQIDTMRERDREADLLHARAHVEIEWPAEYVSTGAGQHLVYHKAMQEAFIDDRATRKALEGELSRLPAPMDLKELHAKDGELAKLEALQARRNDVIAGIRLLEGQLRGKPRTSQYTLDQLRAWMDQWDLRIRADTRDLYRSQLITIHCPNCDHEWHDEDPRLADFKDVPEVVERPAISYRELVKLETLAKEVIQFKGQFEALDILTAELGKLFDQNATIKEIHAARDQVEAYTRSLASAERRRQIEAELREPACNDYSDLVEKSEDDLKKTEQYAQDHARALAAETKRLEALAMCEGLDPNLKADIKKLQDQLTASVAFDSLMLRYHADFKKFREQSEEVSELDFELDSWVLARESLKDTRSTIKQHLVPSLNRVASHLIGEMTGGELTQLQVDEDFDNILVNGVKLHKLSGSGKDVANLAMRLGLGMVLTNRTFSSLWLDEIDAGCDDDRAAYISQCLHNLTATFKQILVISHKPTIVADQRIEL